MMYRVVSLRKIFAVGCFLFCQAAAYATTNGVALTPPMGYNSWYGNGASISEASIKSVANDMATNGMLAAGYQYINLDDGWAGIRDSNGVMVADAVKFPSGIKALADYVHAKGFKFGLYTATGSNTCAAFQGSANHIVQDANTYASWGVDYVKAEGCSVPTFDVFPHEQLYSMMMGLALAQTGRPIVFSASTAEFETWMPQYINLWRCTGDIDGSWFTVLHHIDVVSQSPSFAGPGHWNDPDVMPIGIGAFTDPECETIFSMWSMLAAPLLLPQSETIHTNILCNSEVIAVDQDPNGIQGVCVSSNGNFQVWRKPVGGTNSTTLAVTLFNRGSTTGNITANWSDLGIPVGVATLRDLWAHAPVGTFTNSYTAAIPPHGMQMLKVAPGTTMQRPSIGTDFLSNLQWLADETNAVLLPNNIPYYEDLSGAATTIKLHGVTYGKGLGMIVFTHVSFFLGGGASRFQSTIGVDDVAGAFGTVIFRVYADGVKIYDSGVMTTNSPIQSIDIDITGKLTLTLEAINGQSGAPNGYADWANARVVVPTLPPTVPGGLTASATATQFTLSWYPSYGATHYNLKRSLTAGGPYTAAPIASVTNGVFVDTNISSGATYYYVVSALNNFGESSNSAEISVAVPIYWTNTLTATPQNWNLGGNWSNSAGFPNAVAARAVITNSIASNQTINLNQNITLGSIILGAAGGSAQYSIAPNGGAFIFSNDGNPTVLTELPSSAGDTISAPLVLNDALTVTNGSSNQLTLSGLISGAGQFTDNGPGTVLLGGSNSFTGAMLVGQGLLKLGNNLALGSTNAGTTVNAGSTLDLNGFNIGAEPITVSGSGPGAQGVLVNNGAQQTNALEFLTLAGDTTIGGTGRWDLRGSAANPPPYAAALSTSNKLLNLTKVGGNTISLAGVAVDPVLGNIDVQQGTLQFEGATSSMGVPTNSLSVESGATLAFSQTRTAWNKSFSLTGDGVTASLSNVDGTNTLVGPMTLANTTLVAVASGILNLNGPIGGNGSMVKTLGGRLNLGGTNGFVGNLSINGGTVTITNALAITNIASLAIGTGAVFDVKGAPNALRLAGGQKLSGNGAVSGNLVIGAGAIIAPSNNFQALTFSNSLTFATDSICVMQITPNPNSNETLNVSGTLTYGGKLTVLNVGSAPLIAGQSLKLFNAAGYAGAFQGISPQIPGAALVWDATNLTNNGTLLVQFGTIPIFSTFKRQGNSVVLAGGGGKTNHVYYVLSSTNLTLPVSQWTHIATNSFDAQGNFAFTNAINIQTPATYYFLQEP